MPLRSCILNFECRSILWCAKLLPSFPRLCSTFYLYRLQRVLHSCFSARIILHLREYVEGTSYEYSHRLSSIRYPEQSTTHRTTDNTLSESIGALTMQWAVEANQRTTTWLNITNVQCGLERFYRSLSKFYTYGVHCNRFYLWCSHRIYGSKSRYVEDITMSWRLASRDVAQDQELHMMFTCSDGLSLPTVTVCWNWEVVVMSIIDVPLS